MPLWKQYLLQPESELNFTMLLRILIALFLFSYFSFSFHRPVWLLDEYPQDYFRKPVNHTMTLSGTFGELRANHFHAGIDIRPSVQGREGDPIVASADGFVSRVRVAPSGYGHAIYIDHPNGYTTVYAHVENFYPELEQWIRAQQYAQKKFDVDLYPEPGRFRVTRGSRIATMGNRGSSSAPHLHFEIRHTSSQVPINPLLFGIHVPDNRAPELRLIRIYHLNPEHEQISAETRNIVQRGGRYIIEPETLHVGAWRVGLGLSAIDRLDGAPIQNGIYSLSMWVDDTLMYNFTMDEIGFDETRYLNAHLDYGEQVAHRRFFHKAYRMPGNFAGIYNLCKDDGVIALYEGRSRQIRIEAGDFAGNKSSVQFYLRRAAVSEPPVQSYRYTWPLNEGMEIRTRELRLDFDAFRFYEHPRLTVETHRTTPLGNEFRIGEYTTPVHEFFRIGLRPASVVPYNDEKLVVIHRRTPNGREVSLGGRYDGSRVNATARELGYFRLELDNTPPTIRPVNFSQNMRQQSRMSWNITDNYPTGPGVAAFSHYEARINGEWVLLQYDAKNNLFFHDFETPPDGKTHTVHLEVIDIAGNKATFKGEFVR